MTRRIVSIDPGLSGTAIAIWDRATLVDVDVFRTSTAWSLVERVKVTCEAVRLLLHVEDQLVIEYQQVYGGRAAKGDANDLLKTTLLTGALVECAEVVELVLPTEWKGSAPKSVTQKRCETDLTPSELLVVSGAGGRSQKLQSDAWDAVGIGLWWLRRAGLRARATSPGRS